MIPAPDVGIDGDRSIVIKNLAGVVDQGVLDLLGFFHGCSNVVGNGVNVLDTLHVGVSDL